MLAGLLVDNNVIPLKLTDTITFAIDEMLDKRVHELPVIDGEKFVGIVTFNELKNNLSTKKEKTLSEFKGKFLLACSNPEVTIFEIIQQFSLYQISILPLITENQKYFGTVSWIKLMELLSDMESIKNPGGVIVLETGVHDYSLAEIARIVESNNAKILSVYTSGPDSNHNLSITLKVNLEDIKPILATFERFNYRIKFYYQKSEMEDILESRWKNLLNYLDI